MVLFARTVDMETLNLITVRNLWVRGGALAVLMMGTVGLSQRLLAQGSAQASPPVMQPSQPATDGSAGQVQSTPAPQPVQNDRIFWALPNYLTVENAASLPPLTVKQKFTAVAQGCFDPVEFLFIGIQAGIGQADDVNPTYRQGLSGYSKRFGTAYTDAIIGNFGTGAIFPSLLRQDPRYYQLGTGNFFHRFAYAAARVLVSRSDRTGDAELNFSEFLGNGLAAGLSNAYHPGPHTIVSSANVWSTQVAMDAAGYELKEFWPDIHRFLQRGKHGKT